MQTSTDRQTVRQTDQTTRTHICPRADLSIRLAIHLCAHISVYLAIYLSMRYYIGLRKNAPPAMVVQTVAARKSRIEHRERLVARVEQRSSALPLVATVAHPHRVPP